MADTLQHITDAVQQNCHISDARHAGNYTLCIYLLKMREYYRWEMGYPYSTPLSRDDVGDWLKARERLWDSLEDNDFHPIVIDDQRFDPFDSQGINEALIPENLVYSGGLGAQAKPHFFLGRLQRRERHGDFTILVAAEEFARDLTAPPAMTSGKTVFIRRQSLQRMVWEKVEEWRWNPRDNAMGRAIAYYDFDTDLEGSLETMTSSELETVLFHEIGEAKAGTHLGEAWHELLVGLPRSRTEFMARAVRDHLADCLSTLPELLAQDNPASLHFYFATFNGMRKELFPSLYDAYRNWCDSKNNRMLYDLAQRGADHWMKVAQDMLSIQQQYGLQGLPQLENLLENSPM